MKENLEEWEKKSGYERKWKVLLLNQFSHGGRDKV